MTKVIIEPLRSDHDRAAFNCGNERVNNFLRLSARKQGKEDLAVVRVAVLEGSNTIIGYHSLSAHSLQAEDVPVELRPKGRPFPGIGAFYLGFLGVQDELQGKKLGHLLLRDAMTQTAIASTYGGVAFLVLDAIDAEKAAFYGKFGFVELADSPLRMVIPTKTIRAALIKAGDRQP